MPNLRFTLLLPLLLTFSLTGCSITKAVRIQDHKVIDVKTMIRELDDTPLVFVGERHDAPAHHRLQLEILKGKVERGKRLAIGMEMFEEVSQPALDAWTAGKVPEGAFRKVFEWSWRNISWNLYRDIFIFARDNKVPIVALNAPRGLVQKVSKLGFGSLTKEEREGLPEGVDGEVSDAYQEFIRDAYSVHGRGGDAFRYICEAQMLRNRMMARRITDYLVNHPEASMVVIAGGGHAREKGGIPAELHDLRYKIVLPPLPELNLQSVDKGDADYLLEEPSFWLAEIF